MDNSVALEEASFLVRSPHRIQILKALEREAQTRSSLTDETGVSRVTIGRSLGEMVDRRWLTRADGRYHLQPLGRVVLRATEEFLDTLDTQERFRDVIDLLPTESVGFDIGRLHDAELFLATRHDAGAPTRRYLDLIADASTLLVLKDTVDMAVVDDVSERIADESLDMTIVYSSAAIETTLKIPDARERMVADLAHGKSAFRYDGRITHHLAICDETVLLFLLDDNGVQGFVETDDPMVREWATTTFEEIRDDSERLDPATFRVGE
jgi:predicted transcriptional regulator